MISGDEFSETASGIETPGKEAQASLARPV